VSAATPKRPPVALRECRSLAGRQLKAAVAEVLAELV
jgi:hypothetical protein